MQKTKETGVVSMPWPEIDKIELRAAWISGMEPIRFAVERFHANIKRGRWEFEHAQMNEWRCTREGAVYLRDERLRSVGRKPDPRETDSSRIPEDVCRKAIEFLSEQLRLLPNAQAAENLN